MTVTTMKKASTLSSVVNSYNRAHGTKLTVAQVAKQNPRTQQKKQPVLSPQLPQFKVSNQKTVPTKMEPCVEPNRVKQMLDENRRKLNENPLMKRPDFKITPFKLKF